MSKKINVKKEVEVVNEVKEEPLIIEQKEEIPQIDYAKIIKEKRENQINLKNNISQLINSLSEQKEFYNKTQQLQETRKQQQKKQKKQNKCFSFSSSVNKPAFVSQDRLREQFLKDPNYYMNKNSEFRQPNVNYKQIEPDRNYELQKQNNYITPMKTYFPPINLNNMGEEEKKLYLKNEQTYRRLHDQELEMIQKNYDGQFKRSKIQQKVNQQNVFYPVDSRMTYFEKTKFNL